MNRSKRPSKELPAYAVAIAKAREKKGWTQAQLAEQLARKLETSTSTGTVGGWESGANGVGKKYREAVSKLLDLPITVLVAA